MTRARLVRMMTDLRERAQGLVGAELAEAERVLEEMEDLL